MRELVQQDRHEGRLVVAHPHVGGLGTVPGPGGSGAARLAVVTARVGRVGVDDNRRYGAQGAGSPIHSWIDAGWAGACVRSIPRVLAAQQQRRAYRGTHQFT